MMKIEKTNMCSKVTSCKGLFGNGSFRNGASCNTVSLKGNYRLGCLVILLCVLYYADTSYAEIGHGEGQFVAPAGVKGYLSSKGHTDADAKNAIEAVVGQNAAHEDNHGSGILSRLVVPIGITTISLVVITVFLSIFRRINVRFMMRWHKRSGIVTLIVAVIHAILALIAH